MEKINIKNCLEIRVGFEDWFDKLCEGSTGPEQASLEVFKPILQQSYLEGAQKLWDGFVDAHNNFLKGMKKAQEEWGKERLR